MKSPHTSTEAHGHTSSATPRTESTRDVLDVLASSIDQTAARQTKPEPLLQAPAVSAKPTRELLTEKMLADRWVCSVARLQRWRTDGEGPPYLKIVGKVLYRLKDSVSIALKPLYEGAFFKLWSGADCEKVNQINSLPAAFERLKI